MSWIDEVSERAKSPMEMWLEFICRDYENQTQSVFGVLTMKFRMA